MRGHFDIQAPDELEPREEFPPITNPPLVDQEPADWPEPGEYTPFNSDPLDDLVSQDVIDHVREIVYNDPAVNEHLGGDRPIGGPPSVIEPKEVSEPPMLVFYLYSCATGNTVEVIVDATTMDIVSTSGIPIQPPHTREELDRAIDLAGQELGLTFGADLVGRAMGITVVDPTHSMFGHRLADVRIGDPQYRLPKYFATVDLCAGVVLDAGDVQ
jgi:hypothetical protein